MFTRRKWSSKPRLRGPRNGLTGLPETRSGFSGPIGLDLLYTPHEPLLELIFVHGLHGGSMKTWSKTSDPRHFWPKEWLSRDTEFKNVRIYSFGYRTECGRTNMEVSSFFDIGKFLLSELTKSSDIKDGEHTPIVFIGHGVGGLVMKQVYILANEDELMKPFAARVKGMIFIATRHRVMAPSALENSAFRSVISHKLRGFISDLEQDAKGLQTINDQFLQYSMPLRLLTYYETEKTRVGLTSCFIVDRDSAAMGCPNEDNALLNGSHFGICQFELPSDPNFICLRNALATIARDLTREGILLSSPFAIIYSANIFIEEVEKKAAEP